MAEVAHALEATLRRSRTDWDTWRVYADWLTEQGDARGELVMLEHRLATNALPADEQRALRRRADAVVAAHQGAWLAGLAQPAWITLAWRHGFVVEAKLKRSDALDALDALAAHPTARLLGSLELVRLGLGDEEARALAAAESLSGVTRLDLEGNHIGALGAQALAASETLRNLVWLSLRVNPIGDEGLAALAASESLRGCRVIV
jgi:uncharacterized protein (TIGR02996 family)